MAPLVAIVSFVSTVHGQESPRTLAENLQYHFASLVDPPRHVIFAEGRGRSVLVSKGSGELSDYLSKNSQSWIRDPFAFRIAHPHPLSTISLRESDDPSVHLRFVPESGGGFRTWAHIDLCGPEKLGCHFGELLRNRFTFGRTDQREVYRALIKRQMKLAIPGTIYPEMPPGFDYNRAWHQYVHDIFFPWSIVSTITSSFKFDGPRFGSSLEWHVFNRSLSKSLEFGTAMALRQDMSFRKCLSCSGFRSRFRYALARSYTVETYGGYHELATPRLAAIFGTALIEDEFRWTRNSIHPMRRIGMALPWPVAKSFYAEFGREPVARLTGRLKQRAFVKIGR
jgi:hypothetical protein